MDQKCSCKCRAMLGAAVYWLCALGYLIFISPLMAVCVYFFCKEKKKYGTFIMAYDPLFQRYLLHVCGARDDESVNKIMEKGVPGIRCLEPYPRLNYFLCYYVFLFPFIILRTLTGYTPGFMTTTCDSKYLSSIYVNRITYIDALLEKMVTADDIEQLLVIGAGFDFRASTLSKQHPNIKCIELDLHRTQQQKLMACHAAGVDLKGVQLIPRPLETPEDVVTMAKNVDMDKKTLVVLEGVSGFLTPEVMEALLKWLSTGTKMMLVMDAFTESKCCFMKYCPAAMYVRWMMALIGEPILFTIKKEETAKDSVDNMLSSMQLSERLVTVEARDEYVGLLTLISTK
eukprot:GHVH01007302.1.p1 GENE.GHVH01007302.1~~GHVH01007302.1.p1  ORF type:complete len:343 (-),score=49.26 GHVH01007302.1:118-1146(-)